MRVKTGEFLLISYLLINLISCQTSSVQELLEENKLVEKEKLDEVIGQYFVSYYKFIPNNIPSYNSDLVVIVRPLDF